MNESDKFESATDEYNKMKKKQVIALSVIGVGGAFIITGATLLIFDALRYDKDCSSADGLACKDPSSLQFQPLFGAGPDGASVGFQMQF